MDADYDPNQQSTSKKKRKKKEKVMKKRDSPHIGEKRKKSHFAEVITKNKPVFDPSKCPSCLCCFFHTLTYIIQVTVVSVQMRRALSSTWMSTTRWTMRTS